MKAGAQAAAHKHPHEQFVWMIKGTMDFRIGNEKRTMKPGDVAVIPGGVEHEGYFTEDQKWSISSRPVVKTFSLAHPCLTCAQVNGRFQLTAGHVRYWHIADISSCTAHVRFRTITDIRGFGAGWFVCLCPNADVAGQLVVVRK